MKLRDYQLDAIAKFAESRSSKSENRFLLTAAVGAGKTVIASQIMSDEVRRRGGRCLFLCHRDELIRQTVDKLAFVDDSLRVGVVQAERDEWDGFDVVVASVQTLAVKRRLQAIPTDYFSLVIVDETHRVTAASYLKALRHFGCFDGATVLLGITATADRTDGVSLGTVYQSHIFDIGMLDLIDRGALVPIKALTVETRTDLSGVKKRLGDFAENELASVLNTVNRNSLIAEAVQKYAADRKSLVFCADVKHAEDLAAVMRRYGIRTAAVHGRLSMTERRGILEDYAAGRLQALTTVQLLVEGYDEPSVDCCVWATQTMSKIKYTQGIGRGTRLSPETGKSDLLILDCADNAGRHSLMSVPRLFGVGDAGYAALKAGKTVTEAVEADKVAEEEKRKRDAEAAAAKRQKAVGSGLNVKVVDLFRTSEIPSSMKRSKFDWLAINANRFFVPLFDEQVHVRSYPSGGEWYAEILNHNDAYAVVRSLGASRTIEQAVMRAEAYLSGKYGWLPRKMKDWASEPPSAGQVNAMRRFGDVVPGDKRSAFYAISLSVARSHFNRRGA